MEAELRRLDDEQKAQKATFEKMALQFLVFTKSIEYSTKSNMITINAEGESFSFEGNERVVVTFTTNTGANTIAVLEIATDNTNTDIKVKRVPYNGGARWVVYDLPSYDNNGWRSTNYTFTVQSAVNGNLGAKMIWE